MGKRSKLERLIEEYAKENFNLIIIDKDNGKNKRSLLKFLSKKLNFPKYFGYNWDALYDCITDLEWSDVKNTIIIIKDNNFLMKKDFYQVFIGLLKDAEKYWKKEKVKFKIIFFKNEKMSNLTKKESEKINKIISRLGVAEHVKKEGIEGLITEWDKFVSNCIKGYFLTIDDYTNDLSGRHIIEDVIAKLKDKSLIKKIKEVIKNSDNKFKELLVETDKCVWGPLSAAELNAKELPKEKYWWYWGIIKNPKGELLEDLQKGNVFEGYDYKYLKPTKKKTKK